MELFSLRKIYRICPQHRGPGPQAEAHGFTDFSFLDLRWSVLDEFAPTGSQRRGERVYANLNRRRAAMKPGNGEAARLVPVDGEGGLR
jgi:hypothetical protein